MSQLIVAHPALVIRRLSLPALIAVAAIASAFASGHPVFIVGAVGLCVLLVVLFLRSAVFVRSGQVRSGLGRNLVASIGGHRVGDSRRASGCVQPDRCCSPRVSNALDQLSSGMAQFT